MCTFEISLCDVVQIIKIAQMTKIMCDCAILQKLKKNFYLILLKIAQKSHKLIFFIQILCDFLHVQISISKIAQIAQLHKISMYAFKSAQAHKKVHIAPGGICGEFGRNYFNSHFILKFKYYILGKQYKRKVLVN